MFKRVHTEIECNGVTYSIPAAGQRPAIGVCLDGTGPEHLRVARMPYLWSGVYREANAMIPTLTNTNNVSIITGVPPTAHGVVANTILENEAGARRLQEVSLTDQNRVLCPTILERASQAGLAVLIVTAKKKLVNLLGKGLLTTALVISVEDLHAEGTASLSYSRMCEKGVQNAITLCGDVPAIYSSEASVYCLTLGAEILRMARESSFVPSLVYLSTTDYVQHTSAPSSAACLGFYAAIDHELGRLKDLGEVGVTADHGMHPKPVLHFLEDVLEGEQIEAQVGLAIKDPHMIHHRGFGSYVTVHVEPHLRGRVVSVVRALPGVEMCRINAAGVVEVFGTHDTAFGSTLKFHYPNRDRKTEPVIRTHGGRAEMKVPLALLGTLSSRLLSQFLNSELLYNADLFYYLCQGRRLTDVSASRCAIL